MGKPAVVLLSGGIDSYTAAAMAKAEGYTELYCLTFDYGQRHRKEIESAKAIAQALGAKEHYIIAISLPWGGSSLTDHSIPIQPSKGEGIPLTYVPLRNHIFLNFAAALAEVKGIDTIVCGMNIIDYPGYPDCRPEYLAAQERAWRWGTRKGVEEGRPPFRIYAPLLRMTKGQIIRKGLELGLDYSITWSCYAGGERPCGVCDSCVYRRKGFAEAGITDISL